MTQRGKNVKFFRGAAQPYPIDSRHASMKTAKPSAIRRDLDIQSLVDRAFGLVLGNSNKADLGGVRYVGAPICLPIQAHDIDPITHRVDTGHDGKEPLQIGVPMAEKFGQRLIISGNLVQANCTEDL